MMKFEDPRAFHTIISHFLEIKIYRETNTTSPTTEPVRLELKFMIILCLNMHKAYSLQGQSFKALLWQQVDLSICSPKM